MRTPFRRRLVSTLLVLAATVAGVAAFLQRDALITSVHQLGQLRPRTLALATALTALGVVNRGLLTRRAYTCAGLDIDIVRATGLTATAYSGNKLTKSGGLVGLGAHLHDARRHDLDPTRTVAAYLAISLSGVAGVIGLGALVLADVSLPSFAVVTVASVAAIWSLCRIVARSPRVRVVARRAGGRFGGPVDVEQLGPTCRSLAKGRRHLAWLAAHAIAAKVIGALVLAVVLDGFDLTALDHGTTIRVYALALAAAAFSPLPGGIGATEASLTALLVTAGVDPAVALAATLVFRVFDLWVPALLGLLVAPFVFAGRGLRVRVGQRGAGRLDVEHLAHHHRVPQLATAPAVVAPLAPFDLEAR